MTWKPRTIRLLVCLALTSLAAGIQVQVAEASARCAKLPIKIGHEVTVTKKPLRVATASFASELGQQRLSYIVIPKKGFELKNLVKSIPGSLSKSQVLSLQKSPVAIINSGYFNLSTYEPVGLLNNKGQSLWSDNAQRVSQLTITEGRIFTGRISKSVELVFDSMRVDGGSLNNAQSESNFVVYNQFSSSVRRHFGGVTLVVRQGVVTRRVDGGENLSPNPSELVIQIRPKYAALFSTVAVGDEIAFKIRSEKQTISSFSTPVGSEILRDGVVAVACNNTNELPRPRAAIAWDKQNRIMLVTASSGKLTALQGVRAGGTSVRHFAQLLLAIGAKNAVLLDGGGSVCLFVKTGVGWQRVDESDQAGFRRLPYAIGVVPKD